VLAIASSTVPLSDTLTPTPLPEWSSFKIQQKCVNGFSPFTDSAITEGVVVFFYLDAREGVWATRTTPAEAVQLVPQKTNDTLRISPDHSRLFFIIPDTNPIAFVVVSTDGTDRHEFTWQPDWPDQETSGLVWASNDLLGLLKSDNEVILISPETAERVGTYRIPILELPDLSTAKFPYRDTNSGLTRIAYADKDYHFVMRDFQTGEVILRLDTAIRPYNYPRWSPDGVLIVIDGLERDDPTFLTSELYVIDNIGQGGRVTNFSSVFTKMIITHMAWSPDQSYIALWARPTLPGQPENKDDWQLFVFDRRSNILLDYCIFNHTQGYTTTGFDLLWSPDGSQIYTKLHNETPGLVVDVLTGQVTELPPDIYVIAWGP